MPHFAAAEDTIPTAPGRISRRAQDRARRLGALVDTSGQFRPADPSVDTTAKPIVIDSTARVEQFLHVRRDPLSPLAVVVRDHPLFLGHPTAIQRVDEIVDSSQLTFRARLVLQNIDVRPAVDLTFEEYRQYRLQQAVRDNFRQMAHKYDVEALKKKGLGDLFGQFTKIEIPVPKNPIFSIFGPNIIRLNFNGSVDLHGAFRNIKSDLFTNSPFGQTRNEPDFSQEVQINVQGEVGDKLKIEADWNTQRLFEYENQLKVRYTGYEDEIVKSVEAGNVSLATRSSYISSNQALFGIKAAFQFGPLTMTTLASQKKGQIKDLAISGGARSQPFERRATDYSRDHYFIDTLYIPWFDSVYVNVPARVDERLQIRDIEVWVTRLGIEDPTERNVVAFIDRGFVTQFQNDDAFRSQTDIPAIPGSIEVGGFIRLDPEKDYIYNEYAGFISLNRSLQPEQAIAVAYTLPDITDPTLRNSVNVGNFGTRDTAKSKYLIMKLVRPSRLTPQFVTGWRLMLKNIYPLGGRDVKRDGFRLEIRYEVPGQQSQDNIFGKNLLQILGLDRYDEAGTFNPDNKFDYLPNVTINERRGEIIFPVTKPFEYGLRNYLLSQGLTVAQADSFTFAAVYDTTHIIAANSPRNRFVLKGEITSAISSTYQLGFGNVVEGSVEVIVDGVRATPNVDYSVDYLTGQVVIRNQSFLVPGKNLQIRYEANDLFQLASKTLLGARGEFDVGRGNALGFTVMNLNQQTLSDKVRLGEEPVSNTIMGVDGETYFDLPIFTQMINWLPGISTNAPSKITVRGEVAYLTGDPNTRKSTIAQDRGASIAYIDDFEGSRRTIPISVTYGAWRDLSAPVYIPTIDGETLFPPGSLINPGNLLLKNDTIKIQHKSKSIWYNIFPSDVLVREIWPNRSVARGEEQVTVLNFHFAPGSRGPFNYGMELETTLGNKRKTYGGMQTLMGFSGSNLIDENIGFIELWVKLDTIPSDGKLNIDLGIISEDVIPNRRLNSEDGLTGGIRTGVLKQGEDVGLDMLTNEQERQNYTDFIAKYPQFSGDPSGDDWQSARLGFISAAEYIGINNTEGNSRAEVGRFPDTEDLNRNNILDRVNSYFNYEIPLDTNSFQFRRYIAGGGTNNWYQVRIPLNDFTRRIGDPSLATVEAIRLWVSGASSNVFLRITEFNLVGNQWEERVKNDSTFRVTTVSIEDNLEYTAPPGVAQAKDRTRPDENILLNEQSLALVINGLPAGETREAVKQFNFKPLDVFNYRSMKMFFYGPANISAQPMQVFLRFGVDSLNFYEYRTILKPGWDVENDVAVRFSELTGLKLRRDSVNQILLPIPVPNGPAGATYAVRGNPTLTTIRFISIGVTNIDTRPFTGDIWANELRLIEVDDTPGMAYRFDTGIQFADLMTVYVNFSERDPNFRGLEDRFGTRNTAQGWAVTSTIGFEKFLPESWRGSNLNFSYSHVEQVANPRYLPGTDILISEAAKQTEQRLLSRGASSGEASRAADGVRTESQSLTVQETFSIPSIKLNVPADTWLISETINKMTFGYTYNTTTRRDPVTASFNQWGWAARGAYAKDFTTENFVQPFEWFPEVFPFGMMQKAKYHYLPRNVSFSTAFTRGQAKEQSRQQAFQKPVVRNFTASRSMSFGWQWSEQSILNLATQYQVDVQSSLVHLETDTLGRQRPFTTILGDIFNPKDIVDFGTDLAYTQSMDFSPRLAIPKIFDLDRILNLNARYNVNYSWQNNPQAGVLGKAAAWSNSITLAPDLNLKFIGESLWGPAPPPRPASDTTRPQTDLKELTRAFIKTPIFDFDRISISYVQTNRSQNNGIMGRTGFVNLFSNVPFITNSDPLLGPSQLYQLGFSTDPHADLRLRTKGRFPFIGADIIPGRRAPNGNLVDVFSQAHKVTGRTSRPLWEGARIDLNMSYGTGYTVNRTSVSDADGFAVERSRVVSGDEERSFMTMPDVLFFKVFKTNLEEVYKIYSTARDDINDPRSADQKISDAFTEGMEAAPLVSKVMGMSLPRLNWSMRWDGLEKLTLFSSVASRVSLDHSYNSTMRRRWKLSQNGAEVTESQQIISGFSPLLGINFTFKPLGGGNLSSSFRYGTTTTYDLAPTSQNITESSTGDITIQASYSKTGFEIPLFGYALANDLDISFSYSYAKNSRRLYDFNKGFVEGGTPLEGSSRTVLEPRIRYVLSARVTASVYYKYTKLAPDEGGSRIPGSTTNEGGFDIRIQIAQ